MTTKNKAIAKLERLYNQTVKAAQKQTKIENNDTSEALFNCLENIAEIQEQTNKLNNGVKADLNESAFSIPESDKEQFSIADKQKKLLDDYNNGKITTEEYRAKSNEQFERALNENGAITDKEIATPEVPHFASQNRPVQIPQ